MNEIERFEQSAKGIILAACRSNAFARKAKWGMRVDVLVGGYGTKVRTPCVVIDLERTKPHPTIYGMYVPIVLASGDTWEAVLEALKASGELP